MQAPSSHSHYGILVIPAPTHIWRHTAKHSRCKLQEQTQICVQMRGLTHPYSSTQTQIQFESCKSSFKNGIGYGRMFLPVLLRTDSVTDFQGFLLYDWTLILVWQTHEKVLCLHTIQSITPPSSHRQDTDMCDQEHWDLLEEEWFLSFKSNKASKCKTTMCIDSKEQLRGLDSLCNHLNPQIKPSPAAAWLLFWESDSVSVLCDLISHLHLYENNDMFRAACGPKHHGFQLTKTQQSQQSWLPSDTKKTYFCADPSGPCRQRWVLTSKFYPGMSFITEPLQQTLLSCS